MSKDNRSAGIILKSDFFKNDKDILQTKSTLSAVINPNMPAYTQIEILCIEVSILKVKAGQDIEELAVILGRYILEHKATVRAAAKQFVISKSAVHMALTNQKI